MEEKDKLTLDSSSSTDMRMTDHLGQDGRAEMLEFLKLNDPKKLDRVDSSSSSTRTVDRVELHRKLLEHKQKQKLKTGFGIGTESNVEDEEGPKPESSWEFDSEIDEVLSIEQAAKQKIIDEALKLKAEKEEQARLRQVEEENEREAQRLQKILEHEKAEQLQILEEEKEHEAKLVTEFQPKLLQTEEIAEDIFGFLSKLNDSKQYIFKTDKSQIYESVPELMEPENEKDMTWLLKLSSIDEKRMLPIRTESEIIPETKIQDSAESSSWLFWMFLWIGGRMPFCFERSPESDPEKLEITCEMNKNNCSYYSFVISSLFLIFFTGLSITNLILIISSEDINGSSHIQIEKLLLQRHKVSAIVFIASLVLASISSINVLIYGDSIAEYMTIWGETLNAFQFKSSSGVMAVIIIYMTWSILIFLVQIIVFSFTNSDPNPNPFIESVHLLTAIVFRSFVPNVLVETGNESEIQSSGWQYGVLVLILKSYALYSSLNFVILIVVYSIGIRNMAYEWNFRLRVILHQINVKRNEVYLRSVRLSMNYQNMFDWHRNIVDLVQENSSVFCFMLVAFYLAVGLVFTTELVEIATFVVGEENLTFSLSNMPAQIDKLDKKSHNFMYLCFQMLQTIGIFLFVSLLIGDASSVVTYGESNVRQHNYMNITSTHRRNFFMSLLMSFSSRKPYSLGAGRIFSIDRSFIFGVFVFFVYLLSIMIQTRYPKTLTLPGIVECPQNPIKFCVHGKDVILAQVPDLTNKNKEAADKYFASPKINTTRTTTAPQGDFCKFNITGGTSVGIPDVRLPASCDIYGLIKPFPDGCMQRALSGIQKPFADIDVSYHLVDCYHPTNVIRALPRDDCSNLPLLNEMTQQAATLRAVKVNSEGWDYVLCCYDYGYSNGQLKFCNQKTKEAIRDFCGIRHDFNSFDHPVRYIFVDPKIRYCLDNPLLTTTTCEKIHRCFCGSTPTAVPPSKSKYITCP